jgi:hypothetical protein
MQQDLSAANPANVDQVSAVLWKALPGARLLRIPRNPEHRDILLAVIALEIRRRYPYTEIELNEHLRERLAGLNAEVDHATCRRYLVDCGFLKRDRAGTRYYLYYPKLAGTLSEEVMEQIETLIAEAMADRLRREQRRQIPRSN